MLRQIVLALMLCACAPASQREAELELQRQALNVPPTLTLPAPQTLAEDTSLKFFDGGMNPIGVDDADSNGATEQLSLNVDRGTLTLAGTAGLAFSLGDGTADGAMTFVGTLAALQAALDGLVYTPDANDFGAIQLDVTLNDLGHTAGPAEAAHAALAITVTAVNDPPRAVADLFTVLEASTGNRLDVLANDTSLPDAPEVLEVVAVSAAAHGSVAIASMGAAVTYTPLPGYHGPDAFAYTLTDPSGVLAVAVVTMTVGVDRDLDGLTDGEELTHGTDPDVPDSDGDGLTDGLEVKLLFTSPIDDDTDDDGLTDGNEDANHNGRRDGAETDAKAPDTDGDGLLDGTELGLQAPQGLGTKASVFEPDTDPTTHTDPLKRDTDGGGDSDGAEDMNLNGRFDASETDPNLALDDRADGDRDGITDAIERSINTNPFDADSDDDGVTDGADGRTDTDGDGVIDALDPDSDDDGIFDGTELSRVAGSVTADTNRVFGHFVPDSDATTSTDPKRRDTDGDGLDDGAEDADHDGARTGTETDASKRDTDLDGLDDGVELHSMVGTDPNNPDTDSDGVFDGAEDADHDGLRAPDETDPVDADSDDGGVDDGTELRAGHDPLDPLDDYSVAGGGGGCTSTGAAPLWGVLLALLMKRARRARAAGWVTVLLSTAASAQVSALPVGIDAQRFKLAPGPGDIGNVYSAQPPKHLQLSAQLHFTYADDPLVLANPETRDALVRQIDDQYVLQLAACVGIKERLELGLVLPIIVQRGATSVPLGDTSGAGLGDLRLSPKVALYRFMGVPIALAFALPVSLPTGDVAALRGHGTFSVWPTAIAELTTSFMRVAANLGVDLRPARRLLATPNGTEVTWALAAEAPLVETRSRLSVRAALTGAISVAPLLPGSRPVDVLVGLDLKYRQWTFDIGGGAGLDASPGNPRWRLAVGVGFAADPIRAAEPVKELEPRPAIEASDRPLGYGHVRLDGVLVVTEEPLQFEPRSHRMTDATEQLVREVAQLLTARDLIERRLMIDVRTTDRDEVLAVARAEKLRGFLMTNGVDGARIEMLSRSRAKEEEVRIYLLP